MFLASALTSTMCSAIASWRYSAKRSSISNRALSMVEGASQSNSRRDSPGLAVTRTPPSDPSPPQCGQTREFVEHKGVQLIAPLVFCRRKVGVHITTLHAKAAESASSNMRDAMPSQSVDPRISVAVIPARGCALAAADALVFKHSQLLRRQSAHEELRPRARQPPQQRLDDTPASR